MSMVRYGVAAWGMALLLASCAPGADPSGNGLLEAQYAAYPGGGSSASTGTEVGRRTDELQGELGELQGAVREHGQQLQWIRAELVRNAQEYYGLVSAINSRLQVGTTPGNPILVAQWTEAQAKLSAFNDRVAELNGVGGAVAADNGRAAYLLQSVRATLGLSGAVDEDHRRLHMLADQVRQTEVVINRLLTELSDETARQTAYLNTERSNLQALQYAVGNGELYGASLTNRAAVGPRVGAAAMPVAAPAAGMATGGSALVVIRFDRDDIAYQQPLYQAVSQALQRRPEAMFDLIAVSPGSGGPAQATIAANSARTHAEDVLRTLVAMGLPPERVTLSSATSPAAAGSEVHLYVR